MSYLVCDDCKGYYELKEGESPEDFILKCECGGKLVFVNKSRNPSNESNNMRTLYISSVYGDVLISLTSIIVYKKSTWNAKRTGEVNQYQLDQISKIKVKKAFAGYQLKFKYNEKKVSIKIAELDKNPSLNEIIKFFEELSIPVINYMLGNYAMCPDTDCPNTNYLEIGSTCPECGKPAVQGNAVDKGNSVTLKMEKKNILSEKDPTSLQVFGGLAGGKIDLFSNKIKVTTKKVPGSIVPFKTIKEYLIKDITNVYIITQHSEGMFGSFIFGFDWRAETGRVINHVQPVNFNKSQKNAFYELKSILERKLEENTTVTQKSFSNNSLNDLEKLADLKNKGIITEEEFQAKKKQILGL